MEDSYSAPLLLKILLIAGVVLFFGLGILVLVAPGASLVDRLLGILMSAGALVLLFMANFPLGRLEIRDTHLEQWGLVWGQADLKWADVEARQSDLGASIPRLSDDRRRRQIRIFPLLPEFDALLSTIRGRRSDLWTFPQAMTLNANGWLFLAYAVVFLFSFALAGLAALDGSPFVESLLPGLVAFAMLVQLLRLPVKIEITPDSIDLHYLLGSRQLRWRDIQTITLAEEARSLTARKKLQIEQANGRFVTIGGDLSRNVPYVFDYLQAWQGRADSN